jgi:hypothetical protein
MIDIMEVMEVWLESTVARFECWIEKATALSNVSWERSNYVRVHKGTRDMQDDNKNIVVVLWQEHEALVLWLYKPENVFMKTSSGGYKLNFAGEYRFIMEEPNAMLKLEKRLIKHLEKHCT